MTARPRELLTRGDQIISSRVYLLKYIVLKNWYVQFCLVLVMRTPLENTFASQDYDKGGLLICYALEVENIYDSPGEIDVHVPFRRPTWADPTSLQGTLVRRPRG